MDNTPQIGDIWKCEWSSMLTGTLHSGTKYFLVLDKAAPDNEWKVWSYSRNREEARAFISFSNEIVTSIYTKVA